MTCPKCGSAKVRSSHQLHMIDYFHRFFGRYAFRCRACRCRFYTSKDEGGAAATFRSRLKRRPTMLHHSMRRKRLLQKCVPLFIFIAAFVIFWFFLRYITTYREAGDRPDSRSLVNRASNCNPVRIETIPLMREYPSV